MAQSQAQKILFVLTGNDRLGATGKSTGYHLAEVAQPWRVLREAGWAIDFATPHGGPTPMDPGSDDRCDSDNAALLGDPDAAAALGDTRALGHVDIDDYAAVYFPGGHGTMWDLPDDPNVTAVAAGMHSRGRPVAAVCHGPAALVNARDPEGGYLVAGRRIAAFTDEEEAAVGLDATVPFLLTSTLVDRSAEHQYAAPFAAHVAVDGPLITGQNPASARGVGQALRDALAG